MNLNSRLRTFSGLFPNNTYVIDLQYASYRVSVFEEYLLFDTVAFIGNVGGSLGLFIGFSFYDFASKIVEFLARFWNRSSFAKKSLPRRADE